jgi:hypothetical protein
MAGMREWGKRAHGKKINTFILGPNILKRSDRLVNKH